MEKFENVEPVQVQANQDAARAFHSFEVLVFVWAFGALFATCCFLVGNEYQSYKDYFFPAPLPLMVTETIAPAPAAARDEHFVEVFQELEKKSGEVFARDLQAGKADAERVDLGNYVRMVNEANFPGNELVDLKMDDRLKDLLDPKLRQARNYYWAGYTMVLHARLESFDVTFLGCTVDWCTLRFHIPN